MQRGPFHTKGDAIHPRLRYTEFDEEDAEKENETQLSEIPLIHHSQIDQKGKRFIGGGGYGFVYKVNFDGQAVAQKEHKKDHKSYEALVKEVEFLAKYQHENIVSIIGYTNSPFSAIMEFSPIGSLDSVIQDKRINYPPELAIKFTIDVGEGLKFLHGQKPPIIHRDLKALNVLLFAQEETTVAKICDFGETGVLKNSMSSERGTVMFNAPELQLGLRHYNEKVDVYSFGILLWEVLSRERPFKDHDLNAIRYQVGADKLILDLEKIPSNLDDGNRTHIMMFIYSCLNKDPNHRPSMEVAVSQLNVIFQDLMKDDKEVYIKLLKEAIEVDEAVVVDLYEILKEAKKCKRSCNIVNTAGTIGTAMGFVLTAVGAGILSGGTAVAVSAIGVGTSVVGSVTSTSSNLVKKNSMEKLKVRLDNLLEQRNEIQIKFQNQNLAYISSAESVTCCGNEVHFIRSMVETGQIGNTIVSTASVANQFNSVTTFGTLVLSRGILRGANAIFGLAFMAIDTALLLSDIRIKPGTITQIEEKIEILHYEINKLRVELERVAPSEKDVDLETFEVLKLETD